MFFKRPFVLKTKDMMKLFEGLKSEPKISKELQELLEKIQKHAKFLRRIEDLIRQSKGKFKSDVNKISFYYYLGSPAADEEVDALLKDISLNNVAEINKDIVAMVLGCGEDLKVSAVPKKSKKDVGDLFTAAKNRKRRLKDLQRKIFEDLKKWQKLYLEAKTLVEKMSEGGNGINKLGQKYKELDVKISKIRDRVAEFLKEAGCDNTKIANAVMCIKHPMLEVKKDTST